MRDPHGNCFPQAPGRHASTSTYIVPTGSYIHTTIRYLHALGTTVHTLAPLFTHSHSHTHFSGLRPSWPNNALSMSQTSQHANPVSCQLSAVSCQLSFILHRGPRFGTPQAFHRFCVRRPETARGVTNSESAVHFQQGSTVSSVHSPIHPSIPHMLAPRGQHVRRNLESGLLTSIFFNVFA